MTQTFAGDSDRLEVSTWLASCRVADLALPLRLRKHLMLAGIQALRDLDGLREGDLATLVGLSHDEIQEIRKYCAPMSREPVAVSRPVEPGSGLFGDASFSIDRVSIDCLGLGNLRERLWLSGFDTLGDVIADDRGALEAVDGIGPQKAKEIRDGAARLNNLPTDGLRRLAIAGTHGFWRLPAIGPGILSALALASSVEDEIYGLVVGMTRAEDSMAVLRRWGTVEWPIPSLEIIASERGITRERVRQIVAKREDLLRLSGLRLALASKVAECVEGAGGVLGTAALLARARAVGAPCEAWTLRVFDALGRLGVVQPIRYDDVVGVWTTEQGTVRLHSTGVGNQIAMLVRKTRRALSATGAIASSSLDGLDSERVYVILKRVFRERPYDVEHAHYILRKQRSTSLLTAVERMLAVSGSLSLASVQRGLQRMRRRWTVPTPEVLEEVLRRWDHVEVGGGFIRAREQILPRNVMAGSQFAALVLFEANGGVLTAAELRNGLIAAGYSQPMAALIPREPFIRSLGHALYALRGRKRTIADARSAAESAGIHPAHEPDR